MNGKIFSAQWCSFEDYKNANVVFAAILVFSVIIVKGRSTR